MHTTEHDDVGARASGLATQAERVANEVGHVLDLGPLVVVRQNHGVLLLCDALDFGVQLGDFVFRLDCIHVTIRCVCLAICGLHEENRS